MSPFDSFCETGSCWDEDNWAIVTYWTAWWVIEKRSTSGCYKRCYLNQRIQHMALGVPYILHKNMQSTAYFMFYMTFPPSVITWSGQATLTKQPHRSHHINIAPQCGFWIMCYLDCNTVVHKRTHAGFSSRQALSLYRVASSVSFSVQHRKSKYRLKYEKE